MLKSIHRYNKNLNAAADLCHFRRTCRNT